MERQFVLCLLGDPFTRAERTLIDAGRYDTVREHRHVFHDSIEPQLRAAVERATGCTVTGFIGGVSIEADHVSQLFLLQALEGPELQRISTTP